MKNGEQINNLMTEYEKLKAENEFLKAEAESFKVEAQSLKSESESLKSEAESLKSELTAVKEELKAFKKFIFGSRTEKTIYLPNADQLSMFDEAEANEEATLTEQAEDNKTKVTSYERKKRANLIETLPENVPVERIEHTLSEEDRKCPECGTVMEEIGKDVRKHLVIIPAQVKIREDVYYTYACPKCKKDNIEVPIKKVSAAPSVIPGSYASSESLAYIMSQKFVMGSPLYRTEEEFRAMKVELTRQTMSNWILKASDRWLAPVYELLHKQLLKEKIIHCDETEVQVLREAGKKPQSTSYMWVYCTGKYSNKQIVLYDYKPDRSGQNPVKFLEGFNGYAHTDGYQVYHSMSKQSGITIVGCAAHLRRKWTEAFEALEVKDRIGSVAAEGVNYCNKLFRIEDKIADKSHRRQRKNTSRGIITYTGRLFGVGKNEESVAQLKTGESYTIFN
ncbi:MAG: IS66 family transposase [Bacillota bacterium]|nr:MAG: IS66 family transposase [Bacillota bacterium]